MMRILVNSFKIDSAEKVSEAFMKLSKEVWNVQGGSKTTDKMAHVVDSYMCLEVL